MNGMFLVLRMIFMTYWVYKNTLWLFNIAMENCPFIDDFPINTSIYEGFAMAMLNNQRVTVYIRYLHLWPQDARRCRNTEMDT